MQIVETTAPISLNHLKLYFSDKTTRYTIDYENSQLKDELLLTYLGNLELPCDLKIENKESLYHLLKHYFSFRQIVDIPYLEHKAIDILFQYKGLIETVDSDFINDNLEIISKWSKKLDSLTLYNMWIVETGEFKDFVKTFPENDTDAIEGVNFVSLLKYPHFYSYYSIMNEANLEYYSVYFNEYIFKGNNLYSYWANENNPLFLLTWSIASGQMNSSEYISSVKVDNTDN